MFQKRPLHDAAIAGAMRKQPCTPQKRKQKRWRLVLSQLTRSDTRSSQIYFPFARGLGHARLRHFFLDAGTCRFAEFFLGFLLHRTSMMTSRPKQYSSIHDAANNPRQTLPCLRRASHSRVATKVKAQAEAGETERTRHARITLRRTTKVLHAAIA